MLNIEFQLVWLSRKLWWILFPLINCDSIRFSVEKKSWATTTTNEKRSNDHCSSFIIHLMIFLVLTGFFYMMLIIVDVCRTSKLNYKDLCVKKYEGFFLSLNFEFGCFRKSMTKKNWNKKQNFYKVKSMIYVMRSRILIKK